MRTPLSGASKGVWFPALFLLSISFVFCLPLFRHLHSCCSGDWDYFSWLYEIPLISILDYHQIPLWNPYGGGGMSLIGNPQAGFPSLTFLVTAFAGVIEGLKLSAWLHTFIGLFGMWCLGGYFKLNGPARLVPCFVFMFSSTWALHLAAGHMTWLPAAFLPFLFLSFLMSQDHVGSLLIAAGIESLMILAGGTYVLGFSLLFLLAYSICLVAETRRWRTLVDLAAINFLAVGLTAFKLFPSLVLLARHPRVTDAGVPIPLSTGYAIFLDRFQGLWHSLYGAGWWEFGAYMGGIVMVLYVLSFLYFARYRPLILSSVFFLLLVFGNFSDYSPWTLIHHLPLFHNFKVPTRALFVFCFTVALLAGIAMEKLQQRYGPRSKWLFSSVALLILVDLLSVSSPILDEAFSPLTFKFPFRIINPSQITRLGQEGEAARRPFSQVSIPMKDRTYHGAWSDQYFPLLKNQGVVDAYETIPIAPHAIPRSSKHYRGEWYLRGNGNLSLKSWNPNRLVFAFASAKADRLVINQNFQKGWRTSRGTITCQDGLLAVDLPPGGYALSVWYRPLSFTLGMGVSIVTLAGMAVFFCLRRFSRKDALTDPSGCPS
jgi:hypothetical protein